ncbi:mechanosensitive ion channel family protein [Ancylobacter lacus]|uniref:mechanosensitive ion channel family protein n=1 Tax=Ancylobacter lacus TaxID=2579970 RepID=UPI001BCE2EBB|nr:mechanosensitive ion channel family protein [Ancylobacter lacus]MBS7541185.1 mechanosensitive ion channel family protein [Ancylobacter lacus]
MFGWIEVVLLAAAVVLFALRLLPRLRAYRSLLDGGCVLLLVTTLFPRTGNPVGEFLFGKSGGGPFLPRELFGVLWWVLGAWLVKSLLDLVLRRTFFPDNDEPHARRLFADLASGFIYVFAFIGIVGTVFNEPVSTLLATSGVMAIVLGLALQNTLGDVLSGLAINIERPFGAGDWISLSEQTSGQVMQVNWRATRLTTWEHDTVVIPNSVVTKSVVTNHSRPKGPHRCIIRLKVDVAVAPSYVINAMVTATAGSANVVHGTVPQAYACAVFDSLIEYELVFAIESFVRMPAARSEMLGRIVDAFRALGISIGTSVLDVRLHPWRDPPEPAQGSTPARPDEPPMVLARAYTTHLPAPPT